MNSYDVGPTGYDDSPVYSWDATFDLEAFKQALREYNAKETNAFYWNIDLLAYGHENSLRDFFGPTSPIPHTLTPFSASSNPKSASDHMGRERFERVNGNKRYHSTNVPCLWLC